MVHALRKIVRYILGGRKFRPKNYLLTTCLFCKEFTRAPTQNIASLVPKHMHGFNLQTSVSKKLHYLVWSGKNVIYDGSSSGYRQGKISQAFWVISLVTIDIGMILVVPISYSYTKLNVCTNIINLICNQDNYLVHKK